MKLRIRLGMLTSLLVIFSQLQPVMGLGAEVKYDYPELMMAPRSSDRLQIEADKEESHRWTTFLPIQVSALGTLVAGFSNIDSANPQYAYVGIGTGAAWLVLTGFMSASHRPYASANAEVAPMKKDSTREQLTRERAAEEALHGAARLGNQLKWISIMTNLGASIYMITKGTPSNQGTSQPVTFAQVMPVASAVMALAPFIFRFHWNDVWDEQNEYKKRIYAPVARGTFFVDPATQSMIPGVALSLRF